MDTWDAAAVAGQLPTEELFAVAKREIQTPGDVPAPHLVALHERPTRAVFDQAVSLLASIDTAERELAVLVLRELGRPDENGRRPFSVEAVPRLRERLAQETDPRVLGLVISALGYNAAAEALDEVVGVLDHSDSRVRFHVAAALPCLVDPIRSRSAPQRRSCA